MFINTWLFCQKMGNPLTLKLSHKLAKEYQVVDLITVKRFLLIFSRIFQFARMWSSWHQTRKLDFENYDVNHKFSPAITGTPIGVAVDIWGKDRRSWSTLWKSMKESSQQHLNIYGDSGFSLNKKDRNNFWASVDHFLAKIIV